MYRFLFLILFVTLFWYGVSGILSPIREMSDTKISENFDMYLSGALARNTSPEKLYSVVFYREDFSEEPIRQNYFSGGNTLSYKNSDSSNSQGLIIETGSEKIASPKGNFGTPPTQSSNSFGSSDCAGIIFDPCIILGASRKPTG
jgi:hypothetical protein